MKLRSFLVLFLLLPFLAIAQTNWDTWLQNEGYYLLSPDQKQKFKTMSDPERELFVNNIWASLDPDPITPENEFKKDYMDRYEYAKRHYGIPSDRAKIYIFLGKPNSVESYSNSDRYYPMELWSYYSLGVKNLPPSLDLIFFKPWGAGNYRLYSPLFDGMKALTPSQIDFSNPRMQAQLKAYFDASVVEAAQHISVGYSDNASETVRAYLTDPAAITNAYEKQRPSVETTIVYQGFDAQIGTYSVPYELGITRTSVAIAVPPKYLTFEKDGDIYQARIDLIGKITDAKGREILAINDSPALKMNSSEFEQAKAFSIAYAFDAFLLPGKYSLNVLFRDYASNAAGKMEKVFDVQPMSGETQLLPLLLAMKQAPARDQNQPFTYNMQQYFPKENSSFNDGQNVMMFTTLLNPKKEQLEGIWKIHMGLKKEGTDVLAVDEDLPVGPNTGNLDIARRIHLQSLVPGSYTAFLTFSRGSTTYKAEAPLKITDDPETLGRIRITPEKTNSQEAYHTNVALQYFFAGNFEEASKHARIAMDFTPSSYPARTLLARIDQAKGNTQEAIASYEKLLQESPSDSEGYYLIGKWSMDLKEWQKAEDNMKKAIALGYYTTELLNNLASTEIQLGRKSDAVNYWQKSLEINSDQPTVKEQLSTYKQ